MKVLQRDLGPIGAVRIELGLHTSGIYSLYWMNSKESPEDTNHGTPNVGFCVAK